MPIVDCTRETDADRAHVWARLIDVESFPSYMETVRSVTVLEGAGTPVRLSAWSVLLRGSILEWTEQEEIDEAAGVIRFHQVDGDLDRFEGHWSLRESASGLSLVGLYVDFDIGIPLLADMLNPVAARALEENSGLILDRLGNVASVSSAGEGA